jgi:hypothetical protein
MNQESEIAVVVKWLNPNQRVALHDDTLETTFVIERIFRSPSTEGYVVRSQEEAQRLKNHLEKVIPPYTYRAIDDENRMILDGQGNPLLRREPTIEIAKLARAKQ